MPYISFTDRSISDKLYHGWLYASADKSAPFVLICPPHYKMFKDNSISSEPRNGTSYDIVKFIIKTFIDLSFNVLCIEYPESDGDLNYSSKNNENFENEDYKLASSALSLILEEFPSTEGVWCVGISYGAYLSYRLCLRRPEIKSSVIVSPNVGFANFNSPLTGYIKTLIAYGNKDKEASEESWKKFFNVMSPGFDYKNPFKDVSLGLGLDVIDIEKSQNISIKCIDGGDHLMSSKESLRAFNVILREYINTMLAIRVVKPITKKRRKRKKRDKDYI